MKSSLIEGKAHVYFDGEVTLPFKYSDSYFLNESNIFSGDLANVSMVLTMASFQGSYTNCEEGPKYLKEFLENIGFKDFEANCDYFLKTESNTFGVGIAQKTIKTKKRNYTLLAVGLRGNGYTAEWGGNFNVGERGAHLGFDICATKAINFLKDYIKRHEIIGFVKIWTTGFSRAAAGANMLGGYLDELTMRGEILGECVRLQKSDIYVYTFEAPKGADAHGVASRGPEYNNIFNILNRCDVVPLMGPRGMGFDRYGIDLYVPTSTDEDYSKSKKAMMRVYNQYAPSSSLMTFLTKTLQDKFRFMYADFESTSLIEMITNKITCPEYINRMIDIMTDEMGGRKGFLLCQHEFSTILSAMLGANFEYAMATLTKVFLAISKNSNKFFALIVSQNNNELVRFLEKIIVDTMREMGFALLNVRDVNKLAKAMSKYLIDFMHDYPNETATFIVNIPGIVSYHDPMLAFAWLTTLPSEHFE